MMGETASLPLPSVIVQPSLVYGDEGASARLLRMLASLPVYPRFGTARQPVQPVHVDDLTDLIVALVRDVGAAGGRTTRRLPVVGPEPLPFVAYLAALRAAMGLGRLRVLPLPRWLMPAVLPPAKLLGFAMPDRDTLRMLDRGNVADAMPMQRLLGRAPRPVSRFITHPRAAAVQAQHRSLRHLRRQPRRQRLRLRRRRRPHLFRLPFHGPPASPKSAPLGKRPI